MYKNYLIVASKSDIAGINITTQLSQFGNFNFYLVDDEIIYTKNLDLEKINSYDFIIFASKHKSEKGGKTISIHAPGNWRRAFSRELPQQMSGGAREADFGGEDGKVCKTSALFQKQLFERLEENLKKFPVKYDLTLECTHHGPLIDKPCIFAEIGSTEAEWKDRKAAFVVAKSISEIIEQFKENPYNEIAVAVGGKHYCQSFNRIQMDSNVAISHVIPSYVFPLTEEMIREAIAGTEEDIDIILIDWKGLGNSEQRKQTMDVLNKFYIQKRRTSEISK